MQFEDFHVVARKEISEGVAELLRRAGVRFEQRTIHEIGRPEYVIAVHSDDLAKAEGAFWGDVGPGRVFISNGE